MLNKKALNDWQQNNFIIFLKNFICIVLLTILLAVVSLVLMWMLAIAPLLICYILDLRQVIRCIINIVYAVPICVTCIGFIYSVIYGIAKIPDKNVNIKSNFTVLQNCFSFCINSINKLKIYL